MSIAAPFPYFGGKASVADMVWQALGDVPSYIEPFAGSAAVLLARPNDHAPVRETINDADGFVSNFWRAISRDPDAVAHHADYPVCERDLEARHYWLITEGAKRIAGLTADPDAFDAQVAGWWVWGACAWIGSGWCSGTGPWVVGEDGGWRKLPHLGDAGRGINRKLPHLGDAGRGINRQLPHLGDAGRGESIRAWFCSLADRLRRVVVCSGDWKRLVNSETVMGHNLSGSKIVGIFLDPPYGATRTANLYRVDSADVAADVAAWCLDNGADRRKRIVLAGYAADANEALQAAGWHEREDIKKRNGAGYGNQTGADGNGKNRQRERLWLSPGCLAMDQGALFGRAQTSLGIPAL